MNETFSHQPPHEHELSQENPAFMDLDSYFQHPWPFMPSPEKRDELAGIDTNPRFLQSFVESLPSEMQADVLRGEDNLAHEGDAVWRLIVASWLTDVLNIDYNNPWFSQIAESYKAKNNIQVALAHSTLGELVKRYRSSINAEHTIGGLVEAFEAALGAYFINFRSLNQTLVNHIHAHMIGHSKWLIPFKNEIPDHKLLWPGSRIVFPTDSKGKRQRNILFLQQDEESEESNPTPITIRVVRGKDANDANKQLVEFVRAQTTRFRSAIGTNPQQFVSNE